MAKAGSSSNGRILILSGDPHVGADGAEPHPSYKLLQLPSPSTGQQQQYLLSSSGLLEVNRVKQAACSWLVQKAFVSDGNAYLATPINVVYVLLALLSTHADQAAGMFQEAESLLCCDAWSDALQLLPLAQQHLPCICDTKAADDVTYYKLNNDRVLAFLRVCVAQALAAFRSHSPASIAGLPQQEQQLYALRFLREWLSHTWFDRLASSYGVTASSLAGAQDSLAAARPAAAHHNSSEKKPKVVDPKEAARKKAEESRAATAAAKLQKQAAGSKKISSFFQVTKKPAAGK